ncbi:MAG: hypothetical protein K8F25_17745 [Fimbriimonadaceae bacterium]|nr:hypothetical protein [Alphaproteobacteria bacterium]
MAITFNPANTVARAYTRPKIAPTRADVDNRLATERSGIDNRRDAPAVQLRLSADALAVLAQSRRDTQNASPLPDAKPTRTPGKAAFSFGEIFANLIPEEPSDQTPVAAPARKDAAQAYAPPGSRINIVL